MASVKFEMTRAQTAPGRDGSTPAGGCATGFTLIEIVVTLILVAVLVTGAGMALVPISQAFLLAKETAQMSQQAQLAMARLSREFIQAQTNTIAIVGNNSVTYNVRRGSGLSGVEPHNVSWSGTAGAPLMFGSDILVDDVHTFEITHTPPDGAVNLRLRLTAAPAFDYRVSVYPRN